MQVLESEQDRVAGRPLQRRTTEVDRVRNLHGARGSVDFLWLQGDGRTACLVHLDPKTKSRRPDIASTPWIGGTSHFFAVRRIEMPTGCSMPSHVPPEGSTIPMSRCVPSVRLLQLGNSWLKFGTGWRGDTSLASTRSTTSTSTPSWSPRNGNARRSFCRSPIGLFTFVGSERYSCTRKAFEGPCFTFAEAVVRASSGERPCQVLHVGSLCWRSAQ